MCIGRLRKYRWFNPCYARVIIIQTSHSQIHHCWSLFTVSREQKREITKRSEGQVCRCTDRSASVTHGLITLSTETYSTKVHYNVDHSDCNVCVWSFPTSNPPVTSQTFNSCIYHISTYQRSFTMTIITIRCEVFSSDL